jgi:hypothetical protein
MEHNADDFQSTPSTPTTPGERTSPLSRNNKPWKDAKRVERDGTYPSIVGIENVSVACSVIRALRSSSNSNRFYKQNATRDDHLINDVEHFNNLVTNKADEITKRDRVERQMNEALANYIVPLNQPSMTIVQSPNEKRSTFTAQVCQDSIKSVIFCFI